MGEEGERKDADDKRQKRKGKEGRGKDMKTKECGRGKIKVKGSILRMFRRGGK